LAVWRHLNLDSLSVASAAPHAHVKSFGPHERMDQLLHPKNRSRIFA